MTEEMREGERKREKTKWNTREDVMINANKNINNTI